MGRAYVTLATDDFVPGVLALHNSLLRVKAAHPLEVMGLDLSAEAVARLEGRGLKVTAVSPIANPWPDAPSRFRDIYTKLRVWGMTHLDRAVYIDADALVLQPIDDLFDLPEGLWAAPDHGIRLNNDRFNSGVMVLSPNVELLWLKLASLDRVASYDRSDQGFLNTWYRDAWKRLDYRYNALKRLSRFHPRMFDLASIRVLHFVGSKPWANDSAENVAYGRLHALWREYANDARADKSE